MNRAAFRRPDGRSGTYGQWLGERAALWAALPASDQRASQAAAVSRLTAQIRAHADDGPVLMYLYDEIGYFGIWPADFVEALAAVKGDLELRINSPGGSVFDGMAIYAALREHPAQVAVVVDGLAASAASFIAMAASPGQLAMTPNGTMMVHDAWGLCAGNASEMAEMASLLERTSDNIAAIYAERSGKTVAELRDLMRAETWAVGHEAVDLRLADTVRRPGAGDLAAPALPAAAWHVTVQAGPADAGLADPPDGTPLPGAAPPAAAPPQDRQPGPGSDADANPDESSREGQMPAWLQQHDHAGPPAWLEELPVKEAADR